MRWPRLLHVGLWAAVVTSSTSCQTATSAEVSWFAEQAAGQAQLLTASQPVQPLLDDDDLHPDVRRRLQLVQAARDFAKHDLGLNVGKQYEQVTFIDGPAVVYVVTAAPRTSLQPHLWEYPVLGALPYRGHYDLDKAEAHAQELLARGDLDVDVRPVPTYSLLGILPDPIVSTMLFTSDASYLVETVIHELAHATVFSSSAGSFNEGLATFIGREGSRAFVRRHYGEHSAIYQRMQQVRRDRSVYARAVSALSFDLRLLFARTDLDDDARMHEKDRIFWQHQRHYTTEIAPTMQTTWLRRARLPDNNAEIAAYGIYSLAQDTYEGAFAACNEDWRCFLELLRAAANDDAPELSLDKRARALTPALQVLQ